MGIWIDTFVIDNKTVLNCYYFLLDTLVQEYQNSISFFYMDTLFLPIIIDKNMSVFYFWTLSYKLLLFLVGHSGSRAYSRTFLVILISQIIIKKHDFGFYFWTLSFELLLFLVGHLGSRTYFRTLCTFFGHFHQFL